MIALRSYPEIKVHIVVDERVAGFTALGLAMATGRPCALCCTSGSAVANYYPAVTEAFYQRIPLLLLTADRPADRIDQREGQSIRQKGLFTNHILAELDINEDDLSKEKVHALAESIELSVKVGGPVHWNYPLSEPLYLKAEYHQECNLNDRMELQETSSSIDWTTLNEDWSQAKRVLIIAGQNSDYNESHSNRELLTQFLAEHSNTGLFYESISNLGLTPGVPCIDRLVLTVGAQESQDLLPDLIISFDGEWVTRKVKAWLHQNPNLKHWHIDEHQSPAILGMNPRWIPMNSRGFFQQASTKLNAHTESDYGQKLLEANAYRQERTLEDSDLFPWSDLLVFRVLSKKLQGQLTLFNGNSSVIRYIQLFEWDERIKHLGNRGVSGIDGVTSTSVGYASAVEEEVILISGDLAFLYDSNAFWQEEMPQNLKVIVVNNQGGGIFRIIDGPDQSGWLEEHFEQKHSRKAIDIARMYNLNYFSAANEEELNNSLDEWISSKGISILEIFTPGEENNRVLKNYFKALKHGRS